MVERSPYPKHLSESMQRVGCSLSNQAWAYQLHRAKGRVMIKSVKLLSPNPRSWLLRNHVTGRQSANLTDKPGTHHPHPAAALPPLTPFFPFPPPDLSYICYPYHFNTSWLLKQSLWSFRPAANRRSCSPATPHPVSPVCNGQLGSGDPQRLLWAQCWVLGIQ